LTGGGDEPGMRRTGDSGARAAPGNPKRERGRWNAAPPVPSALVVRRRGRVLRPSRGEEGPEVPAWGAPRALIHCLGRAARANNKFGRSRRTPLVEVPAMEFQLDFLFKAGAGYDELVALIQSNPRYVFVITDRDKIDKRSGSPGRSPSRGPPRSGRGDFHHPAPPWSRLAVTHPQICTTTRGVGRGKSRSKSWNLSHVHRVRWLRRFSHLYHARRACHSRQAKLFRFPLTPK